MKISSISPFIGLLFGVCLVVIDYIFSLYLPTPITTVVLLIFIITVTGDRYLEDLVNTINILFTYHRKLPTSETTIFINPVGSSIMFLLLLAKYAALAEFVGA